MSVCIYSHEDGAYCDKHDHGAVTVGCSGEENCPDKRVLTNAERIRSMTDVELTELFQNLCCPYSLGGEVDCNIENLGCGNCWLSWLKSPIKETRQ